MLLIEFRVKIKRSKDNDIGKPTVGMIETVDDYEDCRGWFCSNLLVVLVPRSKQRLIYGIPLQQDEHPHVLLLFLSPFVQSPMGPWIWKYTPSLCLTGWMDRWNISWHWHM